MAHANVGVRTVFRHVADMNTLFATMHERLEDEIEDLFVKQEQTGDLGTRVEKLVVEVNGAVASGAKAEARVVEDEKAGPGSGPGEGGEERSG